MATWTNATEAQAQANHLNRLDSALAALVRAHAPRVAELAARLARAGFSAERPPTWEQLARVDRLHKSALAELQRSQPPFGGLIPSDMTPAALFFSPGGVLEPLLGTAVRRLARQLSSVGFRAGDRVLNGFAYHFTPGGHLFHDALVQLGATVLPIGPQNTSLAADFARSAGATAFVGIASHLRAILEEAERQPTGTPHPQLRLALAGAEPFGDAVRCEIEQRWGVRCLDLYGTAESGIVALECRAHAGLHIDPDILVEILDPETGDRVDDDAAGELVLSVDAAELPLLRFATGDLVRMERGPCFCGSATSRIKVLGRVGNSARVRGMLLHGAQVREFAARAGGIDACHAVIRRTKQRDEIHVHYHRKADSTGVVDLAQVFKDVCRLRPDTMEASDSLTLGEYAVLDERAGNTGGRER